MPKRPPLLAIVCTDCGKQHMASLERAHDMCIKCANKVYQRQRAIEMAQELDGWQVTMYLDAMVRNETAMPWEKRKIR